jgi:uncharacterized membrane protein YeaQ/YmgE (transglycosylase-associated protein family)
VLAPLAMLVMQKSDWNFPKSGIVWSLVAGLMGATGAFCVLLAFGAKGSPAVVMSIVFAGAPIVSAFYVLWQAPPKGGWGNVDYRFFIGIAMAAIGGCLVTLYKPDVAPKPAPAPTASIQPASSPTKAN